MSSGRAGLGLKIKIRSTSKLDKKARKGFRGYPLATVAFYGPDDTRASKVAVGIVERDDDEPATMERFFIDQGDARRDPEIEKQILAFIEQHGVMTVAMEKIILGCPHEEGIDYPNDEVCPHCPFWADRGRWVDRPEMRAKRALLAALDHERQ